MSDTKNKWPDLKTALEKLKTAVASGKERLKKVKLPKLTLPKIKLPKLKLPKFDPTNNRHALIVVALVAGYFVAVVWGMFAYLKSTNDKESAQKILADKPYTSVEVGTFDRKARCHLFWLSAEFNAKDKHGKQVSGAVCMKRDHQAYEIVIDQPQLPVSPKSHGHRP